MLFCIASNLLRRAWLLVFVSLAACQITPLKELDYDKNYPFNQVQTWQWHSEQAVRFKPESPEFANDLDKQRVQQLISQGLIQRGLNQADNAPISVQAWIIYGDKMQLSTQYYPDMRIGFYDIPRASNSQTLEQKQPSLSLQIDVIDNRTQKLIWRASDQWLAYSAMTNPNKRFSQFAEHIQRLLQQFPPAVNSH